MRAGGGVNLWLTRHSAIALGFVWGACRPNNEAIKTQRARRKWPHYGWPIIRKVNRYLSHSVLFLILVGGKLFLRSIGEVFVKNFRSLAEMRSIGEHRFTK